MTIARRDRANVRSGLSILFLSEHAPAASSPDASLSRCHEVAEEQRRLGGDQFPGLQSLENLIEPVLLDPALVDPLDKRLSAGRSPRRLLAVPLAQDGAGRDTLHLVRATGQNPEAVKQMVF